MGEYKGDVDCQSTWQHLASAKDSVLVDVRTIPEWNFVGVPDLSALEKTPVLIEWQKFPSMEVNVDFVAQTTREIEKRGGGPDSDIFFLCRSGVRSQAAAAALTSVGFKNCFNVLGGFEGPHNENRQRGRVEGWKSKNLPWQQN